MVAILNSGEGIYRNYPRCMVMMCLPSMKTIDGSQIPYSPGFYKSQLFGEMLKGRFDHGTSRPIVLMLVVPSSSNGWLNGTLSHVAPLGDRYVYMIVCMCICMTSCI